METKSTDQKMRAEFLETLYTTLDGVVSPTPYLEISEGEKVSVRFLDGKGRLPTPQTTEINILDIDIASLFFDEFHILYEGVTGVGKTYTSDALFGTLFGSEGQHTIRLSGGILGSSALEPFTVTILENGIPKTKLDPPKCQKYGALFVDEINRGDSQEVFQVVDGVIHLNGDTGYLRIPIPGTDRYKRVAIIAAMNPADAQHSSALELDIAGENRFLKFRFPNGVAEAASSQLEKKVACSLHDQFWTAYGKKSGRKGGWRENYPLIADSEQFAHVLDGETKEFIDVCLGYVGYDPKETHSRNAELMQQGGVKPQFSIRDDNDYRKILQAQGTLKQSFVRRDLRKISNLSKLLAFIKGIKKKTYEAKVKLNDVAASVGVVLESKTVTGTDYGGLMTLVNDARSAYSQLREQMKAPASYGLRQTLWQLAMKTGTEQGFDAYIATLRKGMCLLNTQTGNTAQATMKSRLLADLVVLEHFSQAHESDVKSALKVNREEATQAFAQLYNTKKGESSVYEHRLDSIVR